MLFFKLLFFTTSVYFVAARPENEYNPMESDYSPEEATEEQSVQEKNGTYSGVSDICLHNVAKAMYECLGPKISHMDGETQNSIMVAMLNNFVADCNTVMTMSSGWNNPNSAEMYEKNIVVEFETEKPDEAFIPEQTTADFK